MSMPFMEFELVNADGGKETAKTAPKKYPRADNPNFLERILMQALLWQGRTLGSSLHRCCWWWWWWW